eukprot:6175542-Pleurochrysis_carterae.AAC.1
MEEGLRSGRAEGRRETGARAQRPSGDEGEVSGEWNSSYDCEGEGAATGGEASLKMYRREADENFQWPCARALVRGERTCTSARD